MKYKCSFTRNIGNIVKKNSSTFNYKLYTYDSQYTCMFNYSTIFNKDRYLLFDQSIYNLQHHFLSFRKTTKQKY